MDEGEGQTQFDRGFALDEEKETLAVTVLDGRPDVILKMPEDSWLPFSLAVVLFVMFTGLLFVNWTIVIAGGLGVLAALVAWYGPHRRKQGDEEVRVYD